MDEGSEEENITITNNESSILKNNATKHHSSDTSLSGGVVGSGVVASYFKRNKLAFSLLLCFILVAIASTLVIIYYLFKINDNSCHNAKARLASFVSLNKLNAKYDISKKDLNSNNFENFLCENIKDWTQICKSKNKTSNVLNTSDKSLKSYRLPKNLRPYKYDLTIQPEFRVTEMPKFYDATVVINFTCFEDTNKLILHMQNLNIAYVSVLSETDPNFDLLVNFTWTYEAESNFLIAEFKDQIFKAGNNYSFESRFRGYTQSDNVGFYRSHYLDSNKQKKWVISSQLEPIEARKSFICFDEPEFKAIFKITIIHDSNLLALSNMPVKSKKIIKQNKVTNTSLTKTEFEETLKMSTYLVALVISDFKCKSGIARPILSKQINISVCSRPNALKNIDYAYNISIETIEYFEKLFNIVYPLPKLDHVSVPDFKYGAMENWGLAIYFEKYFLFNKNTTTQFMEQLIVRIISHEVAHMWFGNLVTMKWWDDLWLNEGFARYMEFYGSDKIKPEWKMMDQFLGLLISIIQEDSFNSTRPISTNINSPSEISVLIDPVVTYGKGSATVRMLTFIMGEETFVKGITKYLNKYQYTNVDQYDLWNTLNEQLIEEEKNIELNLTNIMGTWVSNKGHPVVTIKQINATTISLTQNRFILDSRYNAESSKMFILSNFYDKKITFEDQDNLTSFDSFTTKVNSSNLYDKIIWLEPEEDEVFINLSESASRHDGKFILANLDMSGFYRVNYETENWLSIIDQLKLNKNKISERVRAQLISDVFDLAAAGYLNMNLALNMSSYLTYEFDYLPWNTFLNRINFLIKIFDSSASYDYLQFYLQSLIEPVYKKIAWRNDLDWINRLLQIEITRFACTHQLEDCIDTSLKLFKEWMIDPQTKKIPNGLHSNVFCMVMRHGSQTHSQHILREVNSGKDFASKRDMQFGISCSKDTWILSKLLNENINSPDIIQIIKNVASNPNGNLLAWNFVKNNWTDLYKRLTAKNNYFSFLADITSKFHTNEKLKDVYSFFVKDLELKKLNDLTDRIDARIDWVSKYNHNVIQWLTNYQSKKADKINFKLPKNLKPTLYDLTIRPYIGVKTSNQTKFDGLIEIYFDCMEPTSNIIFHSLNLELIDFELRSNEDSGIQIISRPVIDKKTDFVTLTLNKLCKRNAEYVLKINYTGIILDELRGFYKSSYSIKNKTYYLATTQFQPTDARRAFPCFDEPSLKSMFKIQIIRYKNLTSMSNNPLIKTEPFLNDPDWEIDYYDKTLPMSTYLVAFIISNFKVIKTKSRSGIDVEVAGRQDALDEGLGNYALDEAVKIIEFFNDYFNVSYPMPKSTQVGVPDFETGAMENWGLITYRESAIFHNPLYDGLSVKKRITTYVSHELSHQWFGNLVTMEWWNDLWLNEGFASWCEILGSNFSHPEWRDLEFFYLNTMPTMVLDSLEGSHPIRFSVNDPREINSLFDSISYEKGASMVRMMNGFLTTNTFKRGTMNYLNKYKYKNAIQENLWEELTLQAHEDNTLDKSLSLNDIMDAWTLKKGYPIVNIQRKNNSNQLILKQNWFLLNPLNKIKDNATEYKSYRWYIPVTYTTKDELDFDFEKKPIWFKPQDQELTINLNPELNASSWIIANVKHAGFYRVNYDFNNWNLLINQLNADHEIFDATTRAQLIDDSFNLGRAEVIDQLVFLQLIKYLVNETDVIPFQSALHGIEYISDMFSNDYIALKSFQNFCMDLFRPTYKRIGWRFDLIEDSEITFQQTIVKFMCLFGDLDCISKSNYYYARWMQKDEPLPANFKSTIYMTIVKYGNENDWFGLYAKSLKEPYSERVNIMYSLVNTNNIHLLKFLMSTASKESVVRKQDEMVILNTIATHPSGNQLVFDYLEENLSSLIEKDASVNSILILIQTVTKNFNTNYELSRVTRLLNENIKRLELTVIEEFKKAIENVNTNIRWITKHSKEIQNWLLNIVI